jgi:hypothetical protein
VTWKSFRERALLELLDAEDIEPRQLIHHGPVEVVYDKTVLLVKILAEGVPRP